MTASRMFDCTMVCERLQLSGPDIPLSPGATGDTPIVYYGGWSLKELRTCPLGIKHFFPEDWYDALDWVTSPGNYRLLAPLPGSAGLDLADQKALLRQTAGDWTIASVCVLATYFLLSLQNQADAVGSKQWHRCIEEAGCRLHVQLTIAANRLYVDEYRDDCYAADLWLAAMCRV